MSHEPLYRPNGSIRVGSCPSAVGFSSPFSRFPCHFALPPLFSVTPQHYHFFSRSPDATVLGPQQAHSAQQLRSFESLWASPVMSAFKGTSATVATLQGHGSMALPLERIYRSACNAVGSWVDHEFHMRNLTFKNTTLTVLYVQSVWFRRRRCVTIRK